MAERRARSEPIVWDGTPISKPGLYAKVPMERYHSGRLCSGPSISVTGLKTIIKQSPAHFYDKWKLNPDHAPDEMSEALVLGRAAHHLLLGEPHFDAEYVLRPDEAPDKKGIMGPWHGSKTFCIQWMADRAAEGKTVLTSGEIERVKGMALSLSRNPLVRAGALNGLIETTMAWRDEETGIWCLNRPDVFPTDSADVIDLKTTQSVIYSDLVQTYGEFRYYQQGAFAAEGYRAITGEPLASFSLLFIESKRPYCCSRPLTLKAEDLALGARANRAALRRFVKALNTNQWPGPSEDVEFIELSTRQREIVEGRLSRE